MSEVRARADDHAHKLNSTLGDLRSQLGQLLKPNSSSSPPDKIVKHLQTIDTKLAEYSKQLNAPPAKRGRSRERAPTTPRGEGAKDKTDKGDEGAKGRGQCYQWLNKGTCTRANCPFAHDDKRKGTRSASRGRSKFRDGQADKADTGQAPICKNPGCTKPCSIANATTGAYHKHCSKTCRTEHLGLEGRATGPHVSTWWLSALMIIPS